MAEANWRTPALTPEEKTARLVIERFGVRPPVDVRRIAAEYATIKELAFPVSCDASPSGSQAKVTGRGFC